MRAAWLTSVLLLCGWYGFVKGVFGIRGTGSGFAVVYVLVSLVGVTAVVRPWRSRRLDPIPLMIASVVLLGVNLVPAVGRMWAFQPERWQAVAESWVPPPASAIPEPAVRPDVFYIVLDGFGRADVLREHYGHDLGPLVDRLRSQGFYVPALARSNYSQTFLSLASVLNMRYLDDVGALVGPEDPSRLPLHELIQHNAMMALARRAGYETVAIASDYMATREMANADVCLCERRGLDELDHSILALTPLSALPFGRWTNAVHRASVLQSFATIERVRAADKPIFVFAHLVAPHPPFVFARDGSPVTPPRWFGFHDGSHFPGTRSEYLSGYREQVDFIAARMTALVTSLLARPGPSPVIVFHGDHGPGAMLDWRDSRRTNLAERMGVFSAYRFPGVEVELYPRLSLVNGARLLASHYLGVALPPVEDASWFSTWLKPYDFVPVPDEEP
jgi:hypothetical protein